MSEAASGKARGGRSYNPGVILLAIYAVAVCVLAARHRRRPAGYAVAILGAALPMALLGGIVRLVPPSDDTSPLGISLVMYAETVFLLVMGLFVASLPRAHPGGMVCRGCRYNLSGLDPVGLDCPECGAHWRGEGSGHVDTRPARIPIPTGGRKRRPHL